MALLLFRTLLLYFLIFANEVSSLDNIIVRDLEPGDTLLPQRRLRAAKRSHELGARDVKGCLRYDHNLHYLDADTHGSTSQLAAKLGMQFKIPALMLEDVEHHIESIGCYSSEIRLYFKSVGVLKRTHSELTSVDSFLLVTSHEGCNEDGERKPHMVSETTLDLDNHSIILSITRVPWKSTFTSMTLDFGKNDDEYVLRRHGKLEPRQAAVTSSVAATSSVAYPPAPSSTPSNWNASESFNKTWLDISILPPDPSLGTLSVSGPKIPPANFDVKCKNCTVQGNIDLVAGSLTVGGINHASPNTTQGIVNLTESVIDYVEHGYVQFTSNNFAAHIELESTVSASGTLYNYTAPLPTIPLTPFQIPGIASVGAELVPQVFVGFKLEASIDFFYGFEVQIPNNSSVLLDLGNISKSTQSGFSDTNVTALPFQATLPNLALNAVGGFKPQLLLGISFFSGKGTAGAGIFLDAPVLTSTISTVSHVDSKCENVTNSAVANGIIDDVFDTLTHIDASVNVGLGLVAQAELDVGEYSFKDNAPYNLAETSFALPTACMSFDAGAKSYGPASATSSATGSATATQGHSGGKSGAAGVVNPFGAQGAGLRGMVVVSGLMVVGSVCFVLL
ncbi:MAG: hypothetical protein Q9161_007199 [Pseudevernia consocians]